MGRLLRWLIVLVILGGGYWWAFVDGSLPDDASFNLDIAQVRKLADSLPGDKPTRVRYENVAAFRFFSGMLVAGDGWSGSMMPVYAYQVGYPDHTAIIDAAFDRKDGPPDFITRMYRRRRLRSRRAGADQGVADRDHARAHGSHRRRDGASGARFPAAGAARHAHAARASRAREARRISAGRPRRLQADGGDQGMAAVAPGMVVIAAPGHTPGSQMVYVKLADGRELLFLGDVVWHLRNIEVQKERPRWMTCAARPRGSQRGRRRDQGAARTHDRRADGAARAGPRR